ncbi:flagellar basal body P-ring formation protein FlgA [Haematospirillum sp. 15-248]|uniref:flagellar basal body P-ring formation chaperone FlgA n=1 Tax=Haematospirillum sp. 15-248 TaxID=2723107 RepID=UPI0014397C91|nr:flagellar basal body P-ring formation chaperone FlgA [Haematospirillum sp. 15-248]NKD87954.1 flagellar basal body P-ring formation protein FlgA [Haematospirillum sp. 15-248]
MTTTLRILAVFLAAGLAGEAMARTGSGPILVSVPEALMAAAQRNGTTAVPVSLNRNIVVTGHSVRLGDLFSPVTGILESGDIEVIHAPAAGEQLVLGADRLTAISAAWNLGWLPASPMDQVTITRDSTTFGQDDIMNVLRQALEQRGIEPGTDIELTTMPAPVDILAGDLNNIHVVDIATDRFGRFSATLTLPVGGSEPKKLRLSGRLHETVELPVLTRPMTRREIIRAKDITWKRVRHKELRDSALVDADRIIGMELRRSLRPGEPVSAGDVERPVLVARGQMVVIELHTANMSLTARGQALENGSLGDNIRVENLQGKRTVVGTVTGQRTIRVSGPVQSASLR